MPPIVNRVIPSAALGVHRCGNLEEMTGKGSPSNWLIAATRVKTKRTVGNKIYRWIGFLHTEPSNGFGMTSTAAFSVSN